MPKSLPGNSGPRLQKIAHGAKWFRDGSGQVPQPWADEIEKVLCFFEHQGIFEKLLPRLRDDRRSLFSVLAEGRTGLFLDTLGFNIQEWEPPSPTGKPGDLRVQLESGPSIFVEVKAPDWEGELLPEERSERKVIGKSVHAEARAVSPVQMPFQVIRDNALPKLTNDQSNLIVIVDDLFASPADAREVIDGDVDAFFSDSTIARVGGILFLVVETLYGGPVNYHSNFYSNPKALSKCQLPKVVVSTLTWKAEADAAEQLDKTLTVFAP